MAILSANHVSQSFGAADIFSGVTVNLPNDGKVGLVGPNGIGKTTLLQILAGQASPAAGAIHLAKGTRLGYLTQESAQAFANYKDGRLHTVYQEMRTIFAALIADGERLEKMEADMADGDLTDAQFKEYSKLQERFEAAGGYDFDVRIRRTLMGLGFTADEWEMNVTHLSGGQKTRLLLAKLLLEQPNLLIMDEPTNHLDVEAIEWLEGTLKVWAGAVLIVSHDRYFLDKVVNTIWEMSQTGMEQYRGNYSAYVHQREERWERQLIEHKELRERLDKEMDYIRRNIAGQRTQMAQGKLSRLSREVEAIHAGGLDAIHLLKSKGWLQTKGMLSGMKRPADRVGDLQQRINALPRPTRPLTLNLQLKASHRSGRQVLRSKNLTIGYPDHPLFKADDLSLMLGDCAALIGPNGVGKTTLLRTILEQIEPLGGELKRGASLEVGYFSQARDDLNGENSVLEEMLANSSMLISEARSYLGRFLFRGDDVHKRVKSLSGGERGRLALAFLTLQKANFLLLDEPTNHLDIPSQETLQATLEQYDGTILLVSHDRYLVDRLATQIWDLDNGRLHIYPLTYQDFLARQEKERAQAAKASPKPIARVKPITPAAPTLSKNAQRKRAEALHQVEEAITDAENHLATLTLAIEQATQSQNFDKIQSLSVEYTDTETELEELLEQWETLSDE